MSELPKLDSGGKPRLQIDYMIHNGIQMPKCEIEDIKTLKMNEDDIWVCTFPRSGTTLTQELVYLIETLDFDKARSVQLNERFPVIEMLDDRFPYLRGVKFVEQMPSPRFVKSHLHFDFLPEQLQNGKGRIIYVARNPKDVVTSFFNLYVWMDEGCLAGVQNWDTFLQAFVDGTVTYCPWPRHILKFWERRTDEHLLFLKFEDIVKDKPKAVRKIASFLGRTLTDDDIAKICEHCSVDNMRNNDMVNMSYLRDVKHVNDDAPCRFINQGKPGTWKEKLTAEEADKIDVLLKEVEKFGLTFDDEK